MKALLDADSAMVTWWGTRTECISALSRRRREGNISKADEANALSVLAPLSGSWSEMQPTDTVRDLAEQLMGRHPLKAADAMQLAAAHRWADGQPGGYEFVSLDETLRTAAEAEGFTVVPPEEGEAPPEDDEVE